MQFSGYTPAVIAALEKGLSHERLTRYTQLTHGDPERRLRLYLWNAELCAALYLPIQGLEVVLRNALHDELAKVYGPDWFNHAGLPLAHVQAGIVQEIQARLKKQGKAVTPASMVAELSLGFWVALLGKDYDATLWRACLYKAFINRPQPFQRKHIHRELELIRYLRNRIAHHEPILRADLPQHHQRILDAINWFAPEFAGWMVAHSRFDALWHDADNPFLNTNTP